MNAIELWDRPRAHIFLTLAEVLAPLPSRASRSQWSVSDFVYEGRRGRQEIFEVASDEDDELTRLYNRHERVIGSRLVAISKSSPQVIWATFFGYDPPDAAEPWISLHAIDSTFWRYETSDVATRQALIKSFKDVRLVNE